MSAAIDAAIVEAPAVSSALLSLGPEVTSQYQTVTNTEVVAERIKPRNTYRRQFQNLAYGSSGIVFNISNRDVIDEVVCHMKINALADDVAVNRGWGINLIDRVEFDFGGSETLSYTGHQLFLMLMREADTDTKRIQLLRMCGEKADSSAPGDLTAHVPLPLPWSSIQAYNGDKHVGFDTRLLNSNLQITVSLADKGCVFMGDGIDSQANALEYGYFQAKTAELFSPKDQLIRQQLLLNPAASYSYRFMYSQPYYAGRVAGSDDDCSPVTVDLSGFRHGNLQSITLMVRKVDDTKTGKDVKNPLMYRPIRNVRVLLAGNDMYATDANSDGNEWCMSKTLSAGCFGDIDYIANGQTTAPFGSYPDRSHWLTVSLTPEDEKTFIGSVQSGMDLGGETLQVEFNTEETANYEVYATYTYLAHAVCANQTAKIRFSL